MHRAKSAALGALILPLVVASCSSSTDVVQKPSEPTTAHYQVMFPSTAVAVTTETLQVFVFDATDAQKKGTDCLTLFTKQSVGSELPAEPLKLFQSEPVTPCDLFATENATQGGQPVAGKKGALSITYGPRSFLVVTRRANQDYFVGCATKDISQADTTVEISVTQANATIGVPATTCGSLSDKCSGKCT